MGIEKFRRTVSGAEYRAVAVNYVPAAAGGSQNQYLMAAPNKAVLEQVQILSDTASTGSVAAQKYEFNVRNITDAYDMLATSISSVDGEVLVDTAFTLTPDQTTIISKGDIIELQVSATGTPTDLTSAVIIAQANYRPV